MGFQTELFICDLTLETSFKIGHRMHILSTPVSLHLNFKIKFLLENCYILKNLSIFFLTLNLCIDFSHPLLIIFFNTKNNLDLVSYISLAPS